MNTQNNMDTSIAISQPLVQAPAPRKVGCGKAVFRMFCCCFVKNQVKLIQKIIVSERKKFWQRIRDKISKKQKIDYVYHTLLDLYSHKPAIEELENCRISPDFNRKVRDDLEFYVPQLW